jgi:hypothetical protein
MAIFRTLGCILVALALTSCEYIEPSMPAPLNFKRYQPIVLDVGEIQFIEEYKSPMRDPYVEHRLPYSPAEAIRIWVRDRIRASGNEKSLQVLIRDARVVATPLEKSGGIFGSMGLTQDTRYDMSLFVEMRIYGRDTAMSLSSVQASSKRSIVLNDSISLHEREVRFRRMIAEAMEGVNAELEKNIFTYFGENITYQ